MLEVSSRVLNLTVSGAHLGIAVDSNSNVYITGRTASTNFPTKNAFQSTNAGGSDGFITKISNTNSVIKLVTISLDNGNPGTLSYVMSNTTNGETISFDPGITTITFSAGHAPLPALNPGVTLQGVCGNSGPQITIDGSGVSETGLTLGGNNRVTGIAIKGFGGPQISATTTGGNQLYGVKASKH